MLNQNSYDLLVLSPGPGRPEDFAIAKTIRYRVGKSCRSSGVCLGVQAIGRIFRRAVRPTRPSRRMAGHRGYQVRGAGGLMRNLPMKS